MIHTHDILQFIAALLKLYSKENHIRMHNVILHLSKSDVDIVRVDLLGTVFLAGFVDSLVYAKV